MADRDSSSSLSSPGPDSPHNHVSGVLPALQPADEIRVVGARSSGGVATPHSADPTAASTTTAAAPKKRTRKPKEPKPDGEEKDKPAKKPRKPREPKVKNEDGSVPAPQRKRAKAAAADTQKTLDQMVTQFQAPGLPASAPQPPPQQNYPPLILPSQPQQPHQVPDTVMRDSLPPPASKPPTPRPYSSGQNYDPIRGATIDSAPQQPPPPPPRTVVSNGSAHASPLINRASASPSITSLIDPPATKPLIPLSYSSQAPQQTHGPLPPFIGSNQHSPTPQRASISASMLPSQSAPVQQQPPKPNPQQPSLPNMDGAMDVDAPPKQPALQSGLEIKQSKSSSSAPTPQLQKEKKTASPPKAAGTGLLASSDLFGGPGSKQNVEPRGVDICIQIKLNPAGGNTINIAQEIAKKYGRDAINPRAAAHRERLLQVAAAANRLEGGTGDDISVDLMSEVDGDSNVEMGGMDDGGNTATGADDDKPKRKRRRKEEEYDKEDDFIDDTELAWQEKAAVAKDGFFVYSGPLVPEGQTAQVESSTSSGRGRGGGRGRGRGRGAKDANASGRADAEKTKDPNAPTRGRGSRGGRTAGAPRKPRITKADRERMEAEKAERERIANHTNPPPLQLAPTNTVTPPNLGQLAQQQLPMFTNGATLVPN
ncbi:uncharacterized protein MYCFIDRAFT_216902 [Pseudocercospora fijiensis CIRAD86]|uniref:Hpc2-related domain-containing protein n=1 Tax=Pseudocercospora fijiensis (strain CIRAD86) TaxID=383855 RepID=M3AL36_PSEFD|nr:uncharacterized protein MYCFIDRAFT_216902 [Pseudocercospora fijiensis CIRAD86]EME77863.1 hypothetical protein MYCFIDRAFT_216902 [Pseudocercospora fijiensis CIRAD86]